MLTKAHLRSLHVQRLYKEHAAKRGQEPSRELIEGWRAEAKKLWK